MFSTDANQQGEMLQPSAPPSSPRPYDSLLPQLALGGLSWSGTNKKQEENQESKSAALESKSGVEIWKEEQEEDQDLDEGGQQKGKVPIIVSGNDESSGNPQDLNVEMSSSGNDETQKGRDHENEIKASGDSIASEDTETGQNMAFSGSGEENESNSVHETTYMYSSPESGQGENVRRIFPETNFSGSGQPANQETSDDILVSSSGSAQYPGDERLEMTTFSGSGE